MNDWLSPADEAEQTELLVIVNEAVARIAANTKPVRGPKRKTELDTFREQGTVASIDAEAIGHSLVYNEPDKAIAEKLKSERFGGGGFWHCFKSEFTLLICGDKKYEMVRKQLAAASGKSQTALVGTISAAMAANLGLAAGVLTPFCAIGLIVLGKLGREAYCRNAGPYPTNWKQTLGK